MPNGSDYECDLEHTHTHTHTLGALPRREDLTEQGFPWPTASSPLINGGEGAQEGAGKEEVKRKKNREEKQQQQSGRRRRAIILVKGKWRMEKLYFPIIIGGLEQSR